MAIKITTSIGTSHGITDEAYVRIYRYVVDRNKGALELYVNVFKSEADAQLVETSISSRVGAPIHDRFIAKVDAIPHWHSIPMTASVTEVIDGRAYQKNVADFSSLAGEDIFAKAYPLLKARLSEDLQSRGMIAGPHHLVDC